MSPSSPLLSEKALGYLHDTDFLHTKRETIRQLQQWLSETQQLLRSLADQYKSQLPPHALKRSAKISRGENYRGLPYLVLDYPGLLTKEDVFALRTFFWWGNFFSCTLHIEGKSLSNYRPALLRNLHTTTAPDVYICVNNTPWEYHFNSDNYRLLSSLTPQETEALLQNNFFKISRKLPLSEYRQLPAFANESFSFYLQLLNIKQ